MSLNNHYQIIGFHSCDRDLGISIINGKLPLQPSTNKWDWLGHGIYFWELNPGLALDYAVRNATGKQFNKKRIKTPFVIGAIIELGNCLNLTDMGALPILESAYREVEIITNGRGIKMPVNDENNRKLDCTIFNHIHASRIENKLPPYDTIRCAFQEGAPVYPGSEITSKLHIQVCVLNPNMINGYFLPIPIEKYNPYLTKRFFSN